MRTKNLFSLPCQLCSCYFLVGFILLPSVLSIPVANDNDSSDIVVTNSSDVVETAGSISSGGPPVLIEPSANFNPFANISSNVTSRLHQILSGNTTERNRLLTQLFGVDVASSNSSLPDLLQTLRTNGSLSANATNILRQARQFGFGGGFGRGNSDGLLLALLLSDRGRGGGFGGFGGGGFYPPPFYGNNGGGSNSNSNSNNGLDFGELALLSLLGLALISRFPTQG